MLSEAKYDMRGAHTQLILDHAEDSDIWHFAQTNDDTIVTEDSNYRSHASPTQAPTLTQPDHRKEPTLSYRLSGSALPADKHFNAVCKPTGIKVYITTKIVSCLTLRAYSDILERHYRKYVRSYLKGPMLSQRILGQYMTPSVIAQAMCDQIKRPIQDWQVLDPACGDGSLLLATAQVMRKAGIENIQNRLVGIDIDPNMVSEARARLAQELHCPTADTQIYNADFIRIAQGDMFSPAQLNFGKFTIVIANPPYGQLREYEFFKICANIMSAGTEMVFLVPLAFLDRVTGVTALPLDGRPMGVTTGHAIVHHTCGQTFFIRGSKGLQRNRSCFSVLSGVKLYEVGAGEPAQTEEIVRTKPYSSSQPHPGWLPCLRTGDVKPYYPILGRQWVYYGPHLAHPKELSRFQGPRIFIRRVPLWSSRLLAAAYIEETALCAGDVLVIRHEVDDENLLRGLCVYLNSDSAAEFIMNNRPSVKHRISFPKFSAKDINLLLEQQSPGEDTLRKMAQEFPN